MSSDEDLPSQSMQAQIRALAVGECYSRSVRFDLDNLTKADLLAAIDQLRGTVYPAVMRARTGSKRKYTLEVADWKTNSRDVVVTALVTRTK